MNAAQSTDPLAGLSASAAPVTLFYSYAHEDESLRDELQGHLKILERRGLLAPWHDRRINAGEDWAQRIDENLRSAELVLLLVSKDFIESDYIMGTELGAAMARHAQHQTVVVPIVVRAVDLDPDDADALPFLKLQGLPTDLKPVTSWSNRDEAWTTFRIHGPPEHAPSSGREAGRRGRNSDRSPYSGSIIVGEHFPAVRRDQRTPRLDRNPLADEANAAVHHQGAGGSTERRQQITAVADHFARRGQHVEFVDRHEVDRVPPLGGRSEWV